MTLIVFFIMWSKELAWPHHFTKREDLGHRTSFTTPPFNDVPDPRLDSKQTCICVLGVSILPQFLWICIEFRDISDSMVFCFCFIIWPFPLIFSSSSFVYVNISNLKKHFKRIVTATLPQPNFASLLVNWVTDFPIVWPLTFRLWAYLTNVVTESCHAH